jgi:hypothetical protein
LNLGDVLSPGRQWNPREDPIHEAKVCACDADGAWRDTKIIASQCTHAESHKSGAGARDRQIVTKKVCMQKTQRGIMLHMNTTHRPP